MLDTSLKRCVGYISFDISLKLCARATCRWVWSDLSPLPHVGDILFGTSLKPCVGSVSSDTSPMSRVGNVSFDIPLKLRVGDVFSATSTMSRVGDISFDTSLKPRVGDV